MASMFNADPQPVPRYGVTDEHDVTVDPPDRLAPEGEIVDGQVDHVSAARFCHVRGHLMRGSL